MQNYPKKGYLSSDFRVFHLHDEKLRTIPFHYHDFHKIILFLGGDVDYIIEGNSYHLQPDDIVFVAAGEIHRPVFGGDGEKTPYERIVIYIAPDFLQRLDERAKLAKCFAAAANRGASCTSCPIAATTCSSTWTSSKKQPMAKDSPMGCTQRFSLLNS